MRFKNDIRVCVFQLFSMLPCFTSLHGSVADYGQVHVYSFPRPFRQPVSFMLKSNTLCSFSVQRKKKKLNNHHIYCFFFLYQTLSLYIYIHLYIKAYTILYNVCNVLDTDSESTSY